jgi:general secretion pathway protein J
MATRGFTLLELLIAITVTVLLAVGTGTLVFQFSESRARMQSQLDVLDGFQRTMTVLGNDFQQWVPMRPVRNVANDLLPALIIDPDQRVALTRHGRIRLPQLMAQGSDLIRVEILVLPMSDLRCRAGHRLPASSDEFCLLRRWTPYLDGAHETSVQEQLLMGPIQDFRVQVLVYDSAQQPVSFDSWPPETDAPLEMSRLAVQVTMTTQDFGQSEFIWALPHWNSPQETF